MPNCKHHVVQIIRPPLATPNGSQFVIESRTERFRIDDWMAKLVLT